MFLFFFNVHYRHVGIEGISNFREIQDFRDFSGLGRETLRPRVIFEAIRIFVRSCESPENFPDGNSNDRSYFEVTSIARSIEDAKTSTKAQPACSLPYRSSLRRNIAVDNNNRLPNWIVFRARLRTFQAVAPSFVLYEYRPHPVNNSVSPAVNST